MTFVEPSVEMERAAIHLNNAALYLKRVAAAASRGSVAAEHEHAAGFVDHLRLALENPDVAKLFQACDSCHRPLPFEQRQANTTLLCADCSHSNASPLVAFSAALRDANR
jgi:RNA polymerase-binding transcription factor DksA